MAVRHFDGIDDILTVSAGALTTDDGGPHTVLAIFRGNAVEAGGLVDARDGSNNAAWNMNPFSDGFVYYGHHNGSNGFVAVNSYLPDEWYLVGITKPAGPNAAVRQHRYGYSAATWSHASVGGTLQDATNMPLSVVRFGCHNGTDFGQLDLAVIGVWASELADVTTEGLTSSLSAWTAASPDALWAFNQESISDPVLDLTGGGADQTAIVGTAVVTGDDPPGFSFGGAVSLGDAQVNDLIQAQLRAHYPTSTETNVEALLRRWRTDNGLMLWEDYQAEMATAGGLGADAQFAYWTNFTP